MYEITNQNEEVFGDYYNRINTLILKTKRKVVQNINYEMEKASQEFSKLFNYNEYQKEN